MERGGPGGFPLEKSSKMAGENGIPTFVGFEMH